MRSNLVKIIIAMGVVFTLLVGAFFGGILIGWLVPNRVQALAPAPILESNPIPAIPTDPTEPVLPGDQNEDEPADPTDIETLFRPFWEAWNIVHTQFVDQPVDDIALMRGAIRGMMDALKDEHSSYMDPAEFTQANIAMQGEYEGIGAWVDTNEEFLTIISPMPGSPAEEAGLKPGDRIMAIDGKDMTGIDGNLVVRQVMGPAGSMVILTVAREGTEEPFDVEVERAKIVVPSVEGQILEDNIAYVQLFTFGDDTTKELISTLENLMDQEPSGMILDLRNNGGGYLNTAIEVVSQFVGSGVVMIEDYGEGERETYQAIPGGLATEIPLVVLVNEGTASASEIVAGAIQDYGRGQLVGMVTFGKGKVQNWVELKGNEGVVRVTIARWLTPKERQIHDLGLTPDFEVELTEENFLAAQDPQLDKAIELLK